MDRMEPDRHGNRQAAFPGRQVSPAESKAKAAGRRSAAMARGGSPHTETAGREHFQHRRLKAATPAAKGATKAGGLRKRRGCAI